MPILLHILISYKNWVTRRIGRIFFRARLKNKTFSVIANNCWGAEVYQEAGLPYLTPFVGLYIFAPCYVRLLGHLKEYMGKELHFATVSRYASANTQREAMAVKYPIGLLGEGANSVELHFVHYAHEAEAKEKWTRRTRRINWDNLFVKFDDRDLATDELIETFDRLPFEKKLVFTSQNRPALQSAVWVAACKAEPCVPDGVTLYFQCKKYCDVVKWLNGDADFRRT